MSSRPSLYLLIIQSVDKSIKIDKLGRKCANFNLILNIPVSEHIERLFSQNMYTIAWFYYFRDYRNKCC
jgi:hypothetical protein